MGKVVRATSRTSEDVSRFAARLACTCRQGQVSNAESGEAREEEEAKGPSKEARAVQQVRRLRRL